jgi:hypothetical protein
MAGDQDEMKWGRALCCVAWEGNLQEPAEREIMDRRGRQVPFIKEPRERGLGLV